MSRRRVLFVTSNYPRWEGDSTTPFVLQLAQSLKPLGWEVDVLAPHAPGAAKREELGGIVVERFQYLWPSSLETVCYHGGALINLRNQPSNYLKLPPFVMAEWLALLRKLASRKYDILHSHWILPQGFTGVLSAGLLGIPHVITVHGGDIFALRGSLLSRFKHFSLNHADAVTVNSSVTEKAVLELTDGIRELHRIPMGVAIPEGETPASVDEIRSQYRIGKGPLLVFVGRIVEEKGAEDFIKSIPLLLPQLPDATAIIVGDGQDRGRYEQLVASLSLEDRIFFTGWVKADWVPSYLAASDIFIGPSRRSADGWIEAQGLTFTEAMMARTPVIATSSGGITDSVIHQKTGMLVDERSPDQIAWAVIDLVNDPDKTETLVQTAYDFAVRNFSMKSSANRFSELFNVLVQKNRD